jgi:hypothetical protein
MNPQQRQYEDLKSRKLKYSYVVDGGKGGKTGQGIICRDNLKF